MLEKVSKHKKEMLEEIKEIDTILNDKKRLEEEYVKRNKDLPEYNKIFSLSHLIQILIRKRRKIMIKLEEENKLLEPNYYVKMKTQLEKKIELLHHVDLGNQSDKVKKEYLIKLQDLVMECFKIKIETFAKKEEIIDCMYQIRYFNFIYLDEETYIKDEIKLQDKKQEVENLIIKKALEQKVILKITKDENINIDILKLLLEIRVINLEKIFIEITQEEQIVGYLYDTDVLEKKVILREITKQDLLIKKNKKIKVII